jgi:large repetitive protein
MRKLYTLPLSPASLRDVAKLYILGILFFFSTGSVFGQNRPLVITNDDEFTIPFKTFFKNNLNVTLNDFDSLGNKFNGEVQIVEPPKNGNIYNIYSTTGIPIGYTSKATSKAGRDSFTYKICVNGFCDTAKVILNVLNNRPPTALNDTKTVVFNAPFSLTLSSIVKDPDEPTTGALIRFNVIKSSKSDLTIVNSVLSYLPNVPNTKDSITYSVCDIGMACDTGIIKLVAGPNSSPVLDGGYYKTGNNQIANCKISYKDVDKNVKKDTIKVIKPCKNGQILNLIDNQTVSANYYTFSYSPNLNFVGKDSIIFQICDTEGACDTTIVNFNIVNNRAPVAGDDFFSVNFNSELLDSVSANDFDLDYNLNYNSFANLSSANFGVLGMAQNGKFRYAANGQYGIDTISYRVCDQFGLCDTAYLIIKVGTEVIPNKDSMRIASNKEFTIRLRTSLNAALIFDIPKYDPIYKTLPNGTQCTINPNTGYDYSKLKGNIINSIYTPKIGFRGIDTFQLFITYSFNGCGSDTTLITDKYTYLFEVDTFQNYPIGSRTLYKSIIVVGGIQVNCNIVVPPSPLSLRTVYQTTHSSIATSIDGIAYCLIVKGLKEGTDTIYLESCSAVRCDTTGYIFTVNPSYFPFGKSITILDSTTINTPKTLTNRYVLSDTIVSRTIIRLPGKGSAIFTSIYDILYTPNLNVKGVDTVGVRVCNNLACDTIFFHYSHSEC